MDRHKYTTSFETIWAKFALCDPVEMRKRLTNIHKAAERVDARITDLLKYGAMGVSPRFAAAGTTNQDTKRRRPA